MSDSPTLCVSIITPVWNGANYIRDCIACVAAEAKQVPLEHLVIDGAFTDGTAEMLAKLARVHTHIRVVSEPDSGQSDHQFHHVLVQAAERRAITDQSVEVLAGHDQLAARARIARQQPVGAEPEIAEPVHCEQLRLGGGALRR